MATVSFSKVISAGNGYTKILGSDGKTYTLKGRRNWRNNNPGNIEYGPTARRYGAVGSDGRFAVFPNYETGRRAKERLLFEAYPSRYGSDLTIKQAINRYAPAFENDTRSYTNQVARAAGVSSNTPISQVPPERRAAMLDAMERVEGWRVGRITNEAGQRVDYGMFRSAPAVAATQIAGLGDIPTPSSAPRYTEAPGSVFASLMANQSEPQNQSPFSGVLSSMFGAPTAMADPVTVDIPQPQQPPEITAAVAANPESLTPEEYNLQYGSVTPPGIDGVFGMDPALRGSMPETGGILGYGAMTPGMLTPSPMQPLSPPQNVSSMPVASVSQPMSAPPAPPPPTGTDFWTGKSNMGMATNGATLWAGENGTPYLYDPAYDRTVKKVGDNWLNVGETPGIPVPDNIGLPSGSRMMRGAKTLAGGAAGGILGSMLGGPLAGLLAAAAGRNLAQGKGIFGNGGQLNRLEQQARNATGMTTAPYTAGGPFPSAPTQSRTEQYGKDDYERARRLSPAVERAMREGSAGLW